MNNNLKERVTKLITQHAGFDKSDVELADELITLILDENWIPVSERLPDEDGEYLCFIKGNVITRDDINVVYFANKYSWYTGDGEITHWMPLPEPPIDNLRGNNDTNN